MARRRSAETPPELEAKLAGLRERFPLRRKYLVGVSGGRDSVVLLELLLSLGYRKLVVCHVNHGLRGRQSGADAAWVRRLAMRAGVACEVAKVDLRGVTGSVEAAAREARYDVFEALAKRERSWRVFLGHHADDQVETVLMNLCRGSGAAGMAGMREESMRGRLQLLRPLLATWGEALAGYAAERGLRWREDGSNAELGHTRNRVRHRLIPALGTVFGRDVRAAIVRGAAILGEEERLLGAMAEEAFATCLLDGGELDVRRIADLPVALQRRVIVVWLKGVGAVDLGMEVVERVRQLCRKGERLARVNLPGGKWVRRRQGRLFYC